MIENRVFSDTGLEVEPSELGDKLFTAYQTVFGRKPDQAGYQYYMKDFKGRDLKQVDINNSLANNARELAEQGENNDDTRAAGAFLSAQAIDLRNAKSSTPSGGSQGIAEAVKKVVENPITSAGGSSSQERVTPSNNLKLYSNTIKGLVDGKEVSFNKEFYLQQNPDVAASGIDPLQHFVDTGISKGLAGAPPADTYTPESIRSFIDSLQTQPGGASDAQVVTELDKFGITPAQFAQAYGVPVEGIQARYDAAKQPTAKTQTTDLDYGLSLTGGRPDSVQDRVARGQTGQFFQPILQLGRPKDYMPTERAPKQTFFSEEFNPFDYTAGPQVQSSGTYNPFFAGTSTDLDQTGINRDLFAGAQGEDISSSLMREGSENPYASRMQSMQGTPQTLQSRSVNPDVRTFNPFSGGQNTYTPGSFNPFSGDPNPYAARMQSLQGGPTQGNNIPAPLNNLPTGNPFIPGELASAPMPQNNPFLAAYLAAYGQEGGVGQGGNVQGVSGQGDSGQGGTVG